MYRKKFEKDYVYRELRKLGTALRNDVRIYLIGGCNMMFRDAKTATKDIDIVVKQASDLHAIVETLTSLGYYIVKELPKNYQQLGASAVMRNKDGFQCDIFYKQVCGGLEISNRMERRAEFLEKINKLKIYLTAPEDIFLFKSITEREADLEDMRVLIERGLNWSVVSNECKCQKKRKIWEAFLCSKLEELKEKYGIITPIHREIKMAAENEMLKEKFRCIIKNGKPFKEIAARIQKELNYSEAWTRKQLEKLVKAGAIKKEKHGRTYKYWVK